MHFWVKEIPSWHAYQILSFTKSFFGRPFTRSLLTIFEIKSMPTWPNLLCHSQLLSCNVEKQLSPFKAESTSMVYIIPHLIPINTILLSHKLLIMQDMGSKTILYHLSHNWLTLRRLCFKLLTYKTFSIKMVSLLPILSEPMIFPLVLSPNMTCLPSFFLIKLEKREMSLVICLEQWYMCTQVYGIVQVVSNKEELSYPRGLSFKFFLTKYYDYGRSTLFRHLKVVRERIYEETLHKNKILIN